MATNKNSLSYNFCFNFTIGCNFIMNKKAYTYIGQTYERFENGDTENIALVREIGTMNYKALNMNKYGNNEIRFI